MRAAFVTRRRRRGILLASVAGWIVLAATAQAEVNAPWEAATGVRSALANAEKALIVDGPEAASREVAGAVKPATALASALARMAPGAAARIRRGVEAGAAAARAGEGAALDAARSEVWSAILLGSYRQVVTAIEAGNVEVARSWLLVRDFRKPTRFSRPGADATLALKALGAGTRTPAQALAAVRADLLDTYQARLRATLELLDEAIELGYPTRAAGLAALARGYWLILAPSFAAQQGGAKAGSLAATFDALARAGSEGDREALRASRGEIDDALGGFRAAPLAPDEEIRRASQILRFLSLVPVEYGRGVSDGRVTKDFEIQEAITFRDGAAQAFGDLEPALMRLDPTATARLEEILGALAADLAATARGERVAPADAVEALTDEALGLADGTFPEDWKDTGAADFDVIRASLGRLQGAVRAGQYATAEQARIEAYAFFEFGPEQRLRGLAPDLFVRTEGLFWYGADDYPGLAQLIKRKASPEEVGATLSALDASLADSESAVGSGPQSTFGVISNTAIIVFREGLEAVLILAALTAGLVGAQRRYRRPMLLGAAGALVASAATFVIAQTVLGSLARYGEKLEAIVSLVAIAVLLLILNWFFHKVYWSEHLQELHGKKKTLLKGAGLSVAAAQVVGLAMLGFSAVYREGFETVLFLQAIVLEAGAGRVVEGVLLGLVGVALIAVVTIVLQRKLPHRRMLELTGVLILAVLVMMVGKTVQVSQVVGWLSVHPVEGVRLPYWSGAWFGVFPTWEGIAAQLLAVLLVVGSYVGAERMRRRKRARILGRGASAPDRQPDPQGELETGEPAMTR